MMRGLFPYVLLPLASCNLEFGFYITPEERDAEWLSRCQVALDAYCVDEDRDGHTTQDTFTDAITAEAEQREFCESRSAKLETQYFYVPDCAEGDDCDALPKYTTFSPCSLVEALDCDDTNPLVYPGQSDGDVECDGIDNDCDEKIDEDGTGTTEWFPDVDGDKYGNSEAQGVETEGCDSPADGYVMNSEDCDDTDILVNPAGEDSVCSDGTDGNCDGVEACKWDGTVSIDDQPIGAVRPFVGGISVASGDGGEDGIPDLVVVGYDGAIEVIGEDRVESTELGFGYAMAVGDWEGDGDLDVAVGAPESHLIVLLDATGGRINEIEGKSGSTDGGAELASIGEGSNPDWLVTVHKIDSEDSTGKGTWKVYVLDEPASTASVTGDDAIDSYEVYALWPLSLWVSPDSSLLAVGASAEGVKLYSTSGLSFSTSISTTTVDAYLGASVLLDDVMSTDAVDLLIGAPGLKKVYGYAGIASLGEALDLDDATSTWTGATDTGASIALVNDMNGDTLPDLAIGADGILYLLYSETGAEFSTGNLSTAADATISDFVGPVRRIVGAGDQDQDGFNDILVADDENAYLLYGGP